MTMIIYVIPIFTGLTLLAAIAGIYQLQVRNRRITDRLHRVVEGAEETPDFMDVPLPIPLRMVAFFAWILPAQIYSEPLKWDLAQAGFRHLDSRKVFVGARVITTALFGIVCFVVTWKLRLTSSEILMLTLVAAAVGYFAPAIYLRFRQSKRQLDITLSLPDALDLLVICVEAGQGLNAALLKVGRESEIHSPILSEELVTINNEMRTGMTRAQALRNFAMRTGVNDVRALVAVMIQSDRFGTSIAHALRVHAESLRIRRRQRAEEAARKTPVKLVFPLVFCIFPELLVVILAPGMLELFRALLEMTKGQ